jgi:hypothetical protein
MSFEFILDLDCPVKQAIPTESLVGLIKARNQANAILAMARREGGSRPPSEIRFTRRLQTPTGIEDRSVSVQEMLDDSARLGPLEGHCEGCKANVRGKAFGCYGTVAYPIRARTEDWLMGLLPESPESTAGTMLVKAIKDLGYDGRPIARLRPQATFFERKSPAKRRWGSFFSKRQVTSDQMLQMLFCLESLQPAHCLMCALFLGLLPHDLALSDFESALLDRSVRLRLLNKSHMPEDVGDDQIWGMIVFLDAIVRSAAFDLPLATSY